MTTSVVEHDLDEDQFTAFLREPAIAVDTETTGLDWSVDTLRICQLYAPSVGAVIVRRAGKASTSLSQILENPAVRKVFHFAPFDLRFLLNDWGLRVRNVACTKAAAKLAEPGRPNTDYSLQALCDRHLGVTLAKGAVRTSDWGAEVLSQDQLKYAAEDVLHLLALHERLEQILVAIGRAEIYTKVRDYLPVDADIQVTGLPNPLLY